jgi:ribosomal protein L16 Arg81 hydroxylase
MRGKFVHQESPMKEKNKNSPSKKPDDKNGDGKDWRVRKKNLEHRIKALRKIIEQFTDEGKDKK